MKTLPFPIIPLFATLAFSPAWCQSLDDASRSWKQQVENTMGYAQSPGFQSLVDDSAKQSNAAAQAAQVPEGGNYFSIVNGPEVNSLSQKLQAQNRQVNEAVGVDQIRKAKAGLPQLAPESGQRNQSRYFISSDKGIEIITMIRSLPDASTERRTDLLQKIQAYGSQGFPEAVNFIGMSLEYGLFGARRDKNKAFALYRNAASAGYQPALFNMANFLYYGKTGQREPDEAITLVKRAYALRRDDSNRVCGLSAFGLFRAGQFEEAMNYAAGCDSSLAKLVRASLSNRYAYPERISMLRESLSTGADDGFVQLVRVADLYKADHDNLFCKYTLLNKVRFTHRGGDLYAEAAACYSQRLKGLNQAPSRVKQETDVKAIVKFVETEVTTLEAMRQKNRFHYSWSVPYLPFTAMDVALFEKVIMKAAQ